MNNSETICDVCDKRRVAIVTREGDGFCAQCWADVQRAWVELQMRVQFDEVRYG